MPQAKASWVISPLTVIPLQWDGGFRPKNQFTRDHPTEGECVSLQHRENLAAFPTQHKHWGAFKSGSGWLCLWQMKSDIRWIKSATDVSIWIFYWRTVRQLMADQSRSLADSADFFRVRLSSPGWTFWWIRCRHSLLIIVPHSSSAFMWSFQFMSSEFYQGTVHNLSLYFPLD